MTRTIEGHVVVITGASSGIGRATALALARDGCDLVVAARRGEALDQVVSDVAALGRRAIAVPTDVADEASVAALADAALAAFGRIDVWINNAGVSVIGTFDDVPMADIRRVFETDVFGVIYGSRAALPIFRRQGAGTLVNVSSMVAEVPQPYAAAYVAAKAAVRGLSGSLRQELHLQRQHDIHVVTVMPAVIDTPFFASAGNYTGRQVKPPPPVNDPRVVADAIVQAIRKPTREVRAGRPAKNIILQMRLMPAITERMMAKMIDRFHLGDPQAGPSDGNLFRPAADPGAIDGGWGTTAPRLRPRTLMLGAAGLGAAILGLRRRRQG